MTAYLTKGQILASNTMPTETVDVPEWGGSVLIRAWSVAEADAMAKFVTDGVANGHIENYREEMVRRSVVDSEGKLMFEQKDIVKLGQLQPAALNRVHRAILALNKVRDENIEGDSPN